MQYSGRETTQAYFALGVPNKKTFGEGRLRPDTTILLRGGSRERGAVDRLFLIPGRERASLARMQTYRSAAVRLLLWTLAFFLPAPCVDALAAPPKVHVVALGAVRKVPYTPPEAASAAGKPADAQMLKVRALTVDGRQKEWTTGDAHDVTDRSFTVRRAMRLNDALPGDAAARWNWQPGPWLLVDRVTGRVTALHLPDFDEEISEAVWFRDYAAYCGTAETAKGGLFAIVAQLGARRAVVQKQIGKWPQTAPASPVCKAAEWQRTPMRVTLQATGGEAVTFDVVGAASLIEEGDADDEP